ncbi:MAG TPA: DNA-3-methyladenine glycosylase I [Alphaproteobacteria bacterium]|jgi:3-methyladenine DNA glycosylase Tag|nr:DNA-3-methyladenine glycosylase I [Alphaproteobacteria bacterium]
MGRFAKVIALAAGNKGGLPALDKLLADSKSRTQAEIAAIPDGRLLSEMSRRIFQAGFSWKVVDDKWPAFEDLFGGFDPRACANLPEARFDALLKDARIIRNAAKIGSIVANARFILDLAAEKGSAARFIAEWPDNDYIGLLDLFEKRASRLSGQAAMRFLRSIGKPVFITTNAVVTALIREGVLTKPPGGKRDMKTIQDAFNAWSAESGRDLTEISRILAMSVVEDAPPSSKYYTRGMR